MIQLVTYKCPKGTLCFKGLKQRKQKTCQMDELPIALQENDEISVNTITAQSAPH